MVNYAPTLPATLRLGAVHLTVRDLARAALRLMLTRTPIQGASDHGTHEAIYLPDPDGNGIELAADRPRDQWPPAGYEFSHGGPQPLDFESLLATVEGEGPREVVDEGLRMGHLHLHVGDLDEGLRFYRDLLGFEVWFTMPTAAFVAAGGYHHHLGFNTWNGRGAPAPAPHTAGLREWTIQLPSADDVREVRERFEAAGVPAEPRDEGFLVRDPWGTALVVTTAA